MDGDAIATSAVPENVLDALNHLLGWRKPMLPAHSPDGEMHGTARSNETRRCSHVIQVGPGQLFVHADHTGTQGALLRGDHAESTIQVLLELALRAERRCHLRDLGPFRRFSDLRLGSAPEGGTVF